MDPDRTPSSVFPHAGRAGAMRRRVALAADAEALVVRLRQAYEYQVPALATPHSCCLPTDGGSSAALLERARAESLPPGTRLGDFEVLSELGRGGMGVVYRARQVSLQRDVALKVLPGFARYRSSAVRRFSTEARAASRLHHTNIVSVYAQGEHEGQFYYAMELIDGPSLDAALQARGGELSGVSGRRLAALLAEVADGLEHAHREGVIHRDVKPHNLLLGNDGRLHLTDFGLAYLTEEPHVTVPGEIMGTPAYLSPEQVRGRPAEIDQRTDIYSLGATLYEALTGRRPFIGASREQVLMEICSAAPPAPRRVARHVAVDLETICLRAMDSNPARRYPSAAALAEDLRRFAEGRRILSRRPGLCQRAGRWAWRHRAASLSGVAAVITLSTVLGWFWSVQAGRTREATQLLARAYEQLAHLDYNQVGLVRGDLDRAAALGADRQELRLVRALACLGAQEDQAAVEQLIQYLTNNPTDQRAIYLLAWAQRRCGRTAEMQAAWAQGEALGPPASADALFFRGLAIHFADPDVAVESYRQAALMRARERGFFPQAVLHLARARNQQLYATRSLDALPEAVANLEQLVAHETYAGYPHYLLSIAHRLAAEVYSGSQGTRDAALVEEHYDQALSWARRGQTAEPTSDRPITAEAECLESMGEFAAAEEARGRAIAVATKDQFRWEGYHYRWRLRFWLHDLAGAQSDLTACAGYDPDNRFYTHVYPALVLAALGDRDGALRHAHALADAGQAGAQNVLWSATCLRLLGESTAAEAVLRERAAAGLDFNAGLVPPQTEAWVRMLYEHCQTGALGGELETLAQGVAAPWRLWGEACFHTGALRLAAGDRDGAAAEFRRAQRSYDSETRYTYHGKLLSVLMQIDPTGPDWIRTNAIQPASPTAEPAVSETVRSERHNAED
jgi:hypothetical protein